MSGMTRGEVADLVGVNVETVRYYEKRNLIPEPPRTSGGYRIYGDEHVDRIRFVRRAQELGFTLREIDDLLGLKVDPSVDCRDVRSKAEEKLVDVRNKIDDLRRIAVTLDELTDACPGRGPSSECPILDAMRSEPPNGSSQGPAVTLEAIPSTGTQEA